MSGFTKVVIKIIFKIIVFSIVMGGPICFGIFAKELGPAGRLLYIFIGLFLGYCFCAASGTDERYPYL